MKKIIKAPYSFYAINFEADPMAEKYVDIYYKKKGVGNLIRMDIRNIFRDEVKKRILLPNNVKITRIENNKPKVTDVTITYIKK